MTPLPYDAAAAFVHQGERFVLAGHRGPDGDAVGSVLGLALALEALGKEVVRFFVDSTPYQVGFLRGADLISSTLPPKREPWRLILLDCSEPGRAGSQVASFARGRPLMVIDHHLVDSPRGDVVLSDPSAAATGVLVEGLVRALGVRVDAPMAEAIYTSVISDTGSFHYSNTNPQAMTCAARMLEAGADPWKVASHLYEMEPYARLRLLGEVLDTLRLSPDGRCASMVVTREMMDRWGAGEDLLDGFVNYGRRIEGVEISVLIREVGHHRYKCSMRSRGTANVADVAKRFGGGGHHNAAGCHIRATTSTEAMDAVFAAVQEELERCMGC